MTQQLTIFCLFLSLCLHAKPNENLSIKSFSNPIISSVAINNITDCSGSDGSITINAQGTNLEFSINNGMDWFLTNTFNNLPSGFYQIIAREVGNPSCSATDSAILTQPMHPDWWSEQTNKPTNCDGNNGYTTVESFSETVEYSIDGTNWQTSNIFSNLAGGLYLYTVREVGSTNCNIGNLVEIFAPEMPELGSTTTSGESDCGAIDGQILVDVAGTDLEYSINGTNFQNSNLFENLAAGIYSIIIQPMGFPNCAIVDVVEISGQVAPIINNVFATDVTGCNQADGTIAISANGNSLEYSIDGGMTWQTSNEFTGIAAGSYDIVVRNNVAVDCIDEENVVLTAPMMPTIDNINNQMPSDCSAMDGEISIEATGNNLEYSIDSLNFQNSPDFQNLPADDYIIVVREIGTMDCFTVQYITLGGPQMPIIGMIDFTLFTTCGMENGLMTVFATGNNLEYSINNGTTWQTSNIFENLPDGNYDIIVREIDSNECTDIGNAVLVLPILPMMSNLLISCSPDETTYTVSFNVSGGTSPNFMIDGLPGTLNGTLFTSDPILSETEYYFSIAYAPNCPALYISGLFICGCPSITANLEILTDFNGFAVSCFSENDGSATVNNVLGGTAPYTYLWENGEIAATATALADGWQKVTITDSEGCFLVDSIQLNAPLELSLNATANGTSCFDTQDGSLAIGNVSGGVSPYFYSLNNLAFSTDSTLSNLPSGNYPIMVQDANGCEIVEEFFLPQADELTLDLGGNQSIALGESIDIEPIITSSSIDTFIWSSSNLDSLSCENCDFLVEIPTEETTYFLTIIDENGCTAMDKLTVFINKQNEIFAPNVFSPNSDGINDYFTIFGGKSVAAIQKLMVFNRWGATVFEQENFPVNDVNNGWDGRFNERIQDAGVFVFYAEVLLLDGRVEVVKGDVTLVK